MKLPNTVFQIGLPALLLLCGSLCQAQPLTLITSQHVGFEPVITADGSRILSQGSDWIDDEGFHVLNLFTSPFTEAERLFALPSNTDREVYGSVISGDGQTAVMLVSDGPLDQEPPYVVTLLKIDVSTGQAQAVDLPLDHSQSMSFGEFSDLSHDGSRVAFTLYTPATNRTMSMVFDFNSGTLIVPAEWPGSPMAGRGCRNSRLSADGRVLVSHCSESGFLDPGGGAYLIDLQTQTTRTLSETGGLPVVSDDGTIAGYSELIDGVVSYVLVDTQTDQRLRLSVPGTGEVIHVASATLSGNGRYLAFRSDTGSLMPIDTGLQANVFRLDRLTGRFDIVNLANDGSIPNDSCGPMSNLPIMPPSLSGTERYRALSISRDGRHIAMYCAATNLIEGGTESGLFLWRGPAPIPTAVPTLTPKGMLVLIGLIIGLLIARRTWTPSQG